MQYTGSAYFVRRPRRLEDLLVPHPAEEERPYRIIAECRIRAIDYENLVTDLLADRSFIEDLGSRCRRGEVWDCLFVRQQGRSDGVLILPEKGRYIGWAAYRQAE